MTVIDGPTLRALRMQQRVPLRRVAKMARMSHGHLSKVERNEAGRPVTPAVLAAYGQAIGVDLTDIKPSDTRGGWQPGQLNTSARRWYTGKVAAVAWGGQLDDRLNQFLAIRGKLAPPTDTDQAQLSQLPHLAALLASLPGPVPRTNVSWSGRRPGTGRRCGGVRTATPPPGAPRTWRPRRRSPVPLNTGVADRAGARARHDRGTRQARHLHQLTAHPTKLLEQAHAGQEIIVAKAGKPYARLMPLAPEPRHRRPGRLPGRLGDQFFEPLPETELAAWED